MDKNITTLLGGVSAIAVAATTLIAPASAAMLPTNSYSDLLEPIPNATALIAQDSAPAAAKGDIQMVQWHHHHHHHHHNYYGVEVPLPFVVAPRGYYHHHHHHHHHHHRHYYYDNNYDE